MHDFMHAYTTCQRNKSEQLHPAGLLQPLQVSSMVWVDVAMDFIKALPKVSGKSVILNVVDRFSIYMHFIPLGHLYSDNGGTHILHGHRSASWLALLHRQRP
jgi:hypothetical protein